MNRRFLMLVLTLSLATFRAIASPLPDPCLKLDAIAGNHTGDVSDRADGTGPLRVFAIQYKQMVEYVSSYETFALKMDCLMRSYVAPHIDPSKTNLVVFNEDIGLATIATGSRGAAARTIASSPVPGNTPATYDAAGVPAGAAAALGSVAAGYAIPLAAYRTRFPDEDPRKAIITAATDTFVRGFMTVFSRIARDYGVWVVASNNQGEFEYSTDPADVAAFADPDLFGKYASGELTGVWVASGAQAWNNAFLWGPATNPSWSDRGAREYDPRSNVYFTNRKTPLTQIEKDFLALDEGTMDVSNTGPVSVPGLAGFRFGFAISLPAFEFGSLENDPCADASTWMRCMHARGVNTVIQPEANPGPWARYGADGGRFQSLTWGASTLRTVTDPTVPGFKYIVCPHMVGNLVDLPFDGQSAILQRGRSGAARSYAGAWATTANDAPYDVYAGDKPEFLALAPWVLGDDRSVGIDADRATLQDRATAMMAGSLSPYENGYLETAIYADLETPA